MKFFQASFIIVHIILQVEYQSGANQKPLASCCTEELDSSLIPLLHRESSTQSLPCVIELWFRILHP